MHRRATRGSACPCWLRCAPPPIRLGMHGSRPAARRRRRCAGSRPLLEGLVTQARQPSAAPCVSGTGRWRRDGAPRSRPRSHSGPTRVRAIAADAVFTCTPTAFTQSSTRASSARASRYWSTSCWYWPTPIAFGSILTSSASGSCRRRAIDTAPRSETSTSGNSREAISDAEYTDAPASLTTILVSLSSGASLMRSAASLSVSRDAVPLPIAIQLDAMFRAQRAQGMQRLVPLATRLVREDRVGGDELAGSIDHRDFHAGAQSGVEAEHRARAGGRGQQQVLEVVAEHVDGFGFGLFACLRDQSSIRCRCSLAFQVRRAQSISHRIGGAAFVAYACMLRDPARRQQVAGVGIHARVEVELQEFLATAAQQREHAVRWNLCQRLRMVEVVAVLRAVVLLAVDHLRAITPFCVSQSRSSPTSAASSPQRSIRIARAPSRAALVSATPCSAWTYVAATASGDCVGSRSSVSASGSSPASRAICARVRRLGL